MNSISEIVYYIPTVFIFTKEKTVLMDVTEDLFNILNIKIINDIVKNISIQKGYFKNLELFFFLVTNSFTKNY